MSPATIESTVDLPQPEWPMMLTNSPFATLRRILGRHDLRAERLAEIPDLEKLLLVSPYRGRHVGTRESCDSGERLGEPSGAPRRTT